MARLLDDIMHRTIQAEIAREPIEAPRPTRMPETNVRVVEETLIALVRDGQLLEDDFREIMRVLNFK